MSCSVQKNKVLKESRLGQVCQAGLISLFEYSHLLLCVSIVSPCILSCHVVSMPPLHCKETRSSVQTITDEKNSYCPVEVSEDFPSDTPEKLY